MKSLSPTIVLAATTLATTVSSKVLSSSTGCGKPVPELVTPGVSKDLSIDSTSGVTPRKYRIHIPATYDVNTPLPLLFSFHGRTKDAAEQESLTGLSDPSKWGGVVVYPEGVPDAKGNQQWESDIDAPKSINDVTFTLELLDHILGRYCIDPTRVFSTGKSNGGGFTGMLACDKGANGRFAAFAAVAGAFYLDKATNQLPACTLASNRTVVPFMELHGAIDGTVKYEGGENTRGDGSTVSVPLYMELWAQRDGLSDADRVNGTLCGTGNGMVSTEAWGKKGEVTHYKYADQMHVWMSSTGNEEAVNLTCADADATRVVVDFFSRWDLASTSK